MPVCILSRKSFYVNFMFLRGSHTVYQFLYASSWSGMTNILSDIDMCWVSTTRIASFFFCFVLISIDWRNSLPDYKAIYNQILLILLQIESGLFTHSSASGFQTYQPDSAVQQLSVKKKKDSACGIGWRRGTRPTPKVLRETGKECAWETTAHAVRGRLWEDIWSKSTME